VRAAVFGSGRPFITGGLAEPLRLENPTRIVPGDWVTHLFYESVHGIAQMRDTHTGDDCRIPEDDRCVREVVEQPHSCA
jgi:hypothetical protein